ncbi:hypothetical protein JCM9140_855 [Halalkalibacter wakoensis JCM 9140]|uniref:Uncharacterized protein n=1 Tax=Halalkalibacter wakoensis JCM 9140 TaxID=1236970 RepID=W4PYT2_9BACI|nr:hypothetical protein [Halalkalibacter wakoensis]GAE24892.1 hypothetical protein JCM9140_855 [Halalkalibacter wakoensis JCM 9140]
MKKGWGWFSLILCLSLFLFITMFPESASAHRMLIEQVDEQTLHIRYDDGSPAKLAFVSVFDENGTLLYENSVDNRGDFTIKNSLKPYRFVADDGLGHRATFITGNQEQGIETIPLWIRTLLGVTFLFFIAAFFYYRSGEKTTMR